MQHGTSDELRELFAAFELTATYDQQGRSLQLAATISPAVVDPEPVGDIFIAGARYGPVSGPAVTVEASMDWTARLGVKCDRTWPGPVVSAQFDLPLAAVSVPLPLASLSPQVWRGALEL